VMEMRPAEGKVYGRSGGWIRIQFGMGRGRTNNPCAEDSKGLGSKQHNQVYKRRNRVIRKFGCMRGSVNV
jgi:hypothetical protein